MKLDPSEILAFARRDWARIAKLKRAAWLELKRRGGPAEGLRLGAMLRDRAQAEHPEWPREQDRESDHEALVRLLSKLRLASARLGR